MEKVVAIIQVAPAASVDWERKTYAGIKAASDFRDGLPANLEPLLRSAARSCIVSVNTVLQAAWGLLLHSYSSQTDVVFGTTRAGRYVPLNGAANIVGLFINTLPVRIFLRPGTTVAQALAELRTQQIAMRPYEHTPLFRVAQWSGVERGKSCSTH